MTHTPPIFDPQRIKPLTNAQLWQLMQALPDHRVKELKGLSYVEAWDVKATLTRVFGFGGFSTEILSEQIMFEEQVPRSSGSGTNWSIGYKVSLRLIIPQLGAYWDEAAVGSNSQGSRAEATDNAVKGATSDALKRCATMLGTQFGLSLYDKGNQNEIIRTNQVLCVNTLSIGQGDIAALFSTKELPIAERFAAGRWSTLVTGSPVLEGAIASFDGRVVERLERGTHSVIFCEVQQVRVRSDGHPLLYLDRRYRGIGAPLAE